jgi:hypothetical protein
MVPPRNAIVFNLRCACTSSAHCRRLFGSKGTTDGVSLATSFGILSARTAPRSATCVISAGSIGMRGGDERRIRDPGGLWGRTCVIPELTALVGKDAARMEAGIGHDLDEVWTEYRDAVRNPWRTLRAGSSGNPERAHSPSHRLRGRTAIRALSWQQDRLVAPACFGSHRRP